MTTVAWDGYRLVADRQMGYHCVHVSKLRRLNDGSIVGGSGNYDYVMRYFDYLDGLGPMPPFNPDTNMQATILRISKTKRKGKYKMELALCTGDLHEIRDTKFYSIGSGSDYAMGAMAAGATATKAVEIASKLDASTGKDWDILVP